MEHASARFIFLFCCGLARLCDVVTRAQVDGLHALEELIVVFCESVESAEVVGCLKYRCLLQRLIPFCCCLV